MVCEKPVSYTHLKEHYAKAFTNNGLFYPVVLHEGQVIGNWNKGPQKKSISIEHTWFQPETFVDEVLLDVYKRPG